MIRIQQALSGAGGGAAALRDALEWWSQGPWDKARAVMLGETEPGVLFKRGRSSRALRDTDLDALAPLLRLRGGLTPAGERMLKDLAKETAQ